MTVPHAFWRASSIEYTVGTLSSEGRGTAMVSYEHYIWLLLKGKINITKQELTLTMATTITTVYPFLMYC